MEYVKTAIEMIKRHENTKRKNGRHVVYRCTSKRLTLGWGRNVEDFGLSDKEAIFLLVSDINRCENELLDIFGDNYKFFSGNRKAALLDMIFNLGKTRFLGFRSMIEAIKENRWQDASAHALDSLWAKQVKNRSSEIAGMLYKG